MSENKLLTLRAAVDEKVKEYNEAIQNGSFADAVKIEEALDQAVNEYTAEVRRMCFDTCKASENPMLTAVSMLSFMTIATKDEKVGDEKIPVRVVIDKERQIDLFKLHFHIPVNAEVDEISINLNGNFIIGDGGISHAHMPQIFVIHSGVEHADAVSVNVAQCLFQRCFYSVAMDYAIIKVLQKVGSLHDRGE